MSARKVVIRICALLLAVAQFNTQVFAAEKATRKTVGDVLKRIEKNTKKVTFKKDDAALPGF